jgi:type II secretory pathway pseudopilin PulG
MMRLPTLSRMHADERGVGMIELVVVMIIMTILAAIVVPTFLGSRTTAAQNEAAAAATTYNQMINSYVADHGRQTPALGSADWCTPVISGPCNLMRQPYANPAAGVAEGRVVFGGVNARATAPATATGAVEYNRISSTTWEVRSYYRRPSQAWIADPGCVLGNTANAAPSCGTTQ